MKREKVLESLCIYDKRNPLLDFEETKSDDCACDNCFDGKTELAERILELEAALLPLVKMSAAMRTDVDSEDNFEKAYEVLSKNGEDGDSQNSHN